MSEGTMKLLGIILFSGLIAYIGDMVGFRMGKKKISLFGLRPRQTATLITIAFGVIITVITILFASIISDDVRLALFRIEEIKSEIREAAEINKRLTREKEGVLESVKELNIEIIDKKKEIQKLKEFYKELRQSVIVIEVNEIISHVIIEKNTPFDEVVSKFHELFKNSYDKIRERGIKTLPLQKTLKEYDEQIKEKARIIADSPVRFLLQTSASSNLTLKSEPGNFYDIVAISETKIIDEDERLKSPFYIDTEWDNVAIYNAVSIFFKQVEEYLKLKNAFIFGDYFVHPVQLYELVNEIKKDSGRIYLEVVFTKNIYSLGPFTFDIEFVDFENQIEKSEAGTNDEKHANSF